MVSAYLLVMSALASGGQPDTCKHCAEWNTTQKPFPLYGNAYYVGVHGLSSILITSDQGHVLIDSDLQDPPELLSDIGPDAAVRGRRQ